MIVSTNGARVVVTLSQALAKPLVVPFQRLANHSLMPFQAFLTLSTASFAPWIVPSQSPLAPFFRLFQVSENHLVMSPHFSLIASAASDANFFTFPHTSFPNLEILSQFL